MSQSVKRSLSPSPSPPPTTLKIKKSIEIDGLNYFYVVSEEPAKKEDLRKRSFDDILPKEVQHKTAHHSKSHK